MIKDRLFVLLLCLFFLLHATGSVACTGAGPSPQPAKYFKSLPDGKVQCRLCPRRCILSEGERGACTVRQNRGGTLYTLVYGLPCAANVDPIEKKPFFHVLPGTLSFSIATAGCNMRCVFCQNWQISQKCPEETSNFSLSPEEAVHLALERKCRSIAYTYTEPAVFYEYMLETSKKARQAGLLNVMHSCGYIAPEPLRELSRYLSAANIDLKSIEPEFYEKLTTGQVQPVLECLKVLKQEGVWIEITNLVIPGQNDDPASIRGMCRWIRENLGPEVPLHFSRFQPMYRLRNLPPTPVKTLEMARQIAFKEGLCFVYIGNVPGHEGENTYCPKCHKLLIERRGYEVVQNRLRDGQCPFCGRVIPGVFK